MTARAMILTAIVCTAAGGVLGFGQGRATAPEVIAYQLERDRVIDAEMRELMAVPSGRELACHRIFSLVEEELYLEALDLQDELSSIGE